MATPFCSRSNFPPNRRRESLREERSRSLQISALIEGVLSSHAEKYCSKPELGLDCTHADIESCLRSFRLHCVMHEERFFYHCFPRRFPNDRGKGLFILKNIVAHGLLLTPEIISWKEPIPDGFGPVFHFIQKRTCFTQLPKGELRKHCSFLEILHFNLRSMIYGH